MARPRAATYDHQRANILAQAAALFAQRGYSSTSMNEVAQACGVSKAALYHYVSDKSELVSEIAIDHVRRLEEVSTRIMREHADPTRRLQILIMEFVSEYADARDQHRVLTEDVKFLGEEAREEVLQAERRVVDAFASTVAEIRPELANEGLHKAVTMLLFGMINWMFTWLRPEGPLTYERMAPVVSDLFFGGLLQVRCTVPSPSPSSKTTGDER